MLRHNKAYSLSLQKEVVEIFVLYEGIVKRLTF